VDALYERNEWEHQAIIAALRAGNAEGARTLARAHVLHSYELLVHVLGLAPDETPLPRRP
jgi:DNA-binding GntR family transcriptional regulator